MSDEQPICRIIAGPNGAGKTTFALDYLPRVAGCHVFVNADLIAAGLAPLAPEARAIAAGRIVLSEISQHVQARRNFAFESTLSGLAHQRLIRSLKAGGWWIELTYLALPSLELAISRVAERVRHGGHQIPEEDLNRRFFRSLNNFLEHYAFLVDRAVCYCNADTQPIVIFTQWGSRREVSQPTMLNTLENLRTHVRNG